MTYTNQFFKTQQHEKMKKKDINRVFRKGIRNDF